MGWSPPDQALGLAAYQQTSDGLACWEARLGAVTTFREAARLLEELAGVHVGSETLRTQAERVGTELEGQQRRTIAHVEQLHEPPTDEHDPAPGTLVVETDGVMVRYRDRHLDGTLLDGDWHEVKLGVVGGWQHGQLHQASYVAARETAPTFAPRLGAEAARRGALDVVKWHPWDGTPAELDRSWCSAMAPSGSGSMWPLCLEASALRLSTGSTRPSTSGRLPKPSTVRTHPRRRPGPKPPSTISGLPDQHPCWSGSMQRSVTLQMLPSF
jgi:hypothetical protein